MKRNDDVRLPFCSPIIQERFKKRERSTLAFPLQVIFFHVKSETQHILLRGHLALHCLPIAIPLSSSSSFFPVPMQ